MSQPTRPADKAALLAMIQAGYDQLEVLLATLDAGQMTIPDVNDSWSVKDHLAHLAAWQGYQAARMHGVLDGVEPPPLAPGLEDKDGVEDAINEYLYQRYKDHPLSDVLAEFRSSYQRVLAATQALSWEALNAPFPWNENGAPVGAYTLGNTAGHYALHQEIIQRWLERPRQNS